MPRIFGILAFLVLFVISTANSEDQFSMKWKYRADGEISVLSAGDINSDGLNEVIVSSGNTLYVLDKDGNLKRNYIINSTGKISALDIADLDNDGRNEIILGTGWMETTGINEEPFYLSGITMVEKKKRLIKTLKNKGEVHLIDEGIVSEFYNIDGWVRSIDVSHKEIVVGSGGSNTDYFEEIVYDSNGTKRRDYTDYSSFSGSVLVFNETGLIKEYMADNAFYSVSLFGVYGDSGNEIVAGSGKNVYAFDRNLNLLWKYVAMGTVKNIYAGYLSANGEKKIIAGFSNSIDGIHVLNSNGAEFWIYRLPFQSKLSDLAVGDLDLDKNNEILVADKNRIYVLDDSGRLRLDYPVDGGIDRIYLTDLDTNGYMDLIISRGDTVTVYGVTKTLIKMQIAERYYSYAKEFYNAGNYKKAGDYVKNATEIYLEINDTEGISMTDSLSEKILEGTKDNRRMEADSLYSNALGYYSFRDYASAMDYAKKALAIYLEINDTMGVSRTDSLVTVIKRGMMNITGGTTSTTTIIKVKTNATSEKTPEISNYLIFFIIIIAAAFIVLTFTRIMSKVGKE